MRSINLVKWLILWFAGHETFLKLRNFTANIREHFGMFGGYVKTFTRIVLKLEKIGRWGLEKIVALVLRRQPEMSFIGAFAHRIKLVPVIIENQVAWTPGACKQNRNKIQAVALAIPPRRHTRQGEAGVKQIE